MKAMGICFLILFVGVFVSASANPQTPPPFIPNSTDYVLVFNDEFNDPSTKAKYWTPDHRDGRGDEWAGLYGIIENGNMRLLNRLLPSPVGTRRFTAPTCKSVEYFKYGYFECRYKYAASTGFNNSFWLLNEGGAGLDKDYIEIDINEGQMDEGGKRNKAAYDAAGAQPDWDHIRPLVLDHSSSYENTPKYIYTPVDLSADYHTYGFLWTPDWLVFYVDGVEVLKRANRTLTKFDRFGIAEYRILNYPMRVYLSSMNDGSIPHYDKAVESSMEIDYVRVYQIPGLTEDMGLPPVSGDNLLKNGEFGPYDTGNYANGSSFNYMWSTGGTLKNGYLSIDFAEKRSSPYYAPSQIINVPKKGIYELSFKARITDKATGANFNFKISDNTTGYATSILSSIVALSSGGDSNSSISVTSDKNQGEWKTYHYRFNLSPNASAEKVRFSAFLNNTQGGATFDFDDIELKAISVGDESSTAIVKDSGFNIPLVDAATPQESNIGWSAMAAYQSMGTTSIVDENGNKFARKTITAANGREYHMNISQYSTKSLLQGKYRLKMKARGSVGKSIELKISAKSNLATPAVSNLENLYSLSLTTLSSDNHIGFLMQQDWTEYECKFDLNTLSAGELIRIYFYFSEVGTFDLDDVVVEPYLASSLIGDIEVGNGDVRGGVGAVCLENCKGLEVVISAVNGQVMVHKQLNTDQEQIVLSKGMYILALKDQGQSVRKQVVIVQ